MKNKKAQNPSRSGGTTGQFGSHKPVKGKARVFKSRALSRKEKRKELRKSKKLKRQEFAARRAGKPVGGADDPTSKKYGGGKKPEKTKPPKPASSPASPNKSKNPSWLSKQAKMMAETRREEAQLRKDMEVSRRKRLLEDNEDEDRNIRQLEKKLKLNRKAIIPASFRTDGLDYLLEVCSSKPESRKSIGGKSGRMREDDSDLSGSDRDNSKNPSARYDDSENSDFDGGNSDDEEELEDSENIHSDDPESTQEDDDDDDGGEDFMSDEDLVDASLPEECEQVEDEDFPAASADESEDVDDANVPEGSAGISKAAQKGYWEDIYGRLRAPDGSIVNEKNKMMDPGGTSTAGSKYIPPALRGRENSRGKLLRSLKGLLNRLAEANMHSISQQVEQMYLSNSRNEMNESLLELYYSSLIQPTVMSERILLEHSMLVTILHGNIGTEIGAFFLQNFVQKFKSLYEQTESLEDSKELYNITLLVAGLYHFKVVGCGLLFEILAFLTKSFGSKDVELILALLKMIGFRLRKDDPTQLKNLILSIQQRAATPSDLADSRVKFMLEILLAIRNNNVSKIPNYDPSFGEHLVKMLKQHLRPGNYVTELKVGMQDLLDADTKGRWWIVGSAWNNDPSLDGGDASGKSKLGSDSAVLVARETPLNVKLLKKAKKFGMNTDIRRHVFCVLMSAEDYLDAFEKLMRLGLKNGQERELVHVALYCGLQERKYNPYYALVLSKLCSTDRKYMLTLQYSLWDRLKDLDSLKASPEMENLSQLLAALITGKSLSIAVLKVVQFGEMDERKLSFLKSTLRAVLLSGGKEEVGEIFSKIALSEKLRLFRESLRLFMAHFLLANPEAGSPGTTESERDRRTLEERVKVAEKSMQFGRVQF